MINLFEKPLISKRDLLNVAKQCPANIFRLAKYLKLHVVGYSPRQTAKLISWLFRRIRE